MSIRKYNFVNGPETSTPPTSGGTPTDDADLVPKGYADEFYGKTVSGTRASPLLVTAGGGISTSDTMWETQYIKGSGGAVNITVNPQISASTKIGSELILICTDDTDTVQFDDGTGLLLNGNFLMTANCVLCLEWDGTNYFEKYRTER